MRRSILLTSGLFFIAVSSLGLTGCKDENRLIQKATFKAADNLETVRVSLLFGPKVKPELSGGFQIKDYGYLFMNPYTETSPFEVGFDLDTDIVNDQDFIHLEPTSVYPNGIPIGLPYSIVEVRRPSPIHGKFDVYAYVDVLKGKWMGLAFILNFMNDDNFPRDLALTQAFMRDDEGKPGVLASVFGPVVDNEGNLTRNGGIMVMANVKQLIDAIKDNNNQMIVAKPEGYFLTGSQAEEYEQKPQELGKLERNVIQGLNKL